jgi:hypothetical protein
MGAVGRIVGCIFMLGFGGALILSAFAGMRALIERIWLRIRGSHATGTVVDVLVEEDPDLYPKYTPTVEFVGRAGERRVERVRYATARECEVGDRVRVFYRPGEPSQVFIEDLLQGVWIVLFFPVLVAAGAVFIAAAGWVLAGTPTIRLGNYTISDGGGGP